MAPIGAISNERTARDSRQIVNELVNSLGTIVPNEGTARTRERMTAFF